MPTGYTNLASLQAMIHRQKGVGPQSAEQINASIRMLQMALQAGDPPKTDEDWKLLFHDEKLRSVMRYTTERLLAERQEKAAKSAPAPMADANATMLFSGPGLQ